MTNTYDRAPGAPPGEDRTLAVIGYALLIAGLFTSGVTSLVAVVLAYVKRDTPDPVAASHFNSQIRTFWIGFIGTAIGVVFFLGAAGLGGYATYLGVRDTTAGLDEIPASAIAAIIAVALGFLFLLAVQIWVLVREIYGMIRIASHKAIGG